MAMIFGCILGPSSRASFRIRTRGLAVCVLIQGEESPATLGGSEMRKLLLVLVGVVVFGGGEQLSAEVIFSDTTFASADWLAESGPTWLLFGQRPSNQGTSFTAMQEATGGSGGGAYRFSAKRWGN